uniref:Aminotransferase-like plant mobile domain-containing protein n=1 Tax=Oryza rufipogon TaxID=4529 RepID=A0A0E0P4X2_ORYRU
MSTQISSLAGGCVADNVESSSMENSMNAAPAMATMNSTNPTLVRTFAILQQVRMFQVVVALVLFSLEPFMLLKQERCISGSSYLVLQYQIPKKQVASRRILEKKFNRTMTVHEQIVFKTAFIIFVVTKFLAPQSVNNHISIRYMKALVDVENIHKYNWAEFVLHDIKDAAAALQHKIRHRKSIGYINGCIILPQLFYLDNLDFGTDTPEQENIPRIGVYNDSMIAEFIEKDVILKNRNPFPAYGKMKKLQTIDIFIGFQLRNKHDEKYNIGHHTGATEAIHVDRTYDARSDIEPPSFNLGITQDIEEVNMVACTPGHDISNVAEDSYKEQELNFLARTPDQPISKSVDASDKSGEVGREEYACTKLPPKSKRRIIGGPSDILFDRPKRSIKPSHLVKSPFLSKQHSFVRHDQKALDDLCTYAISIADAEALKKIWVHISQPVPMSLSLHDIQQAIRLDTQMQEETFNVAVQVLVADAIQRFGGTDFVGWRHFLNQDFAMFATAGDDQWNPEDHLPSFKDDSLIPYVVPSCHLECMKLAFPDWGEDIPNWVSKFPSVIPALNNKFQLDCAFHVLYYMRNWDGTRLVNPPKSDQRDLRKEFLSNLLSFKNNEAILPDFVVHCLKLSNKI